MVLRHDALRVAWQACRNRVPVSAEAFANAFDGWEVHPIERGGQVVAAVLIKGDEVHAASIAPGKWLSRAVLRKSIGAIVDRYGVCRTAVMRDNAAGHAFVRRLGFEPVSHGEVTQYELRKPRHV